MEGGVKPRVENQLEQQNQKVQSRWDAFDQRMIRQMGSVQNLNIVEVKEEVAEIKKMVNELYDWPFILVPVITEVEPKIHVVNIWDILESKYEGRNEKKKRNHWSTEK